MAKVLTLSVGGIEVTLGEPDPDTPGAYLGGRLASSLRSGDGHQDEEGDLAVDVLESLVLAHACAGVDVTSPAYQRGLTAALDAISNHLS